MKKPACGGDGLPVLEAEGDDGVDEGQSGGQTSVVTDSRARDLEADLQDA